MRQPVAQPHQLQRGGGMLHPLFFLKRCELQRQLHILDRSQHRNQIEALEHEPDMLIAPMRDRTIRKRPQILTQHQNLSVRRPIHRRDQVQQRGLSRSRGSHQRHELALVDFQVRVLQRHHVKFVAHELLGQIPGLNHDLWHV